MKYRVSEKKIYTTTEYGIFVFADWNRDVSNARVVKMMESITRVGWLPEPILVNEHFEVIDGQSRLKALEALGMPVEFCIARGIGRTECQMMNIFQKNWTTSDYINSYIADGNDNYIWLKAMIGRYKNLTPSVVESVVVGKGTSRLMGGKNNAAIQDGSLKLNEAERVYTEKVLFYLSRFAETINYLGGRKDTFYSALMFLYNIDGVDKERLCAVVNNARYDRLVASGTVEGWLLQMEELYNKGLRKGNKIDAVHEFKIA